MKLGFALSCSHNRGAKKIGTGYCVQVELILAMADINCEVVMTQRANHAFDELKQLVDSKWNSIDGVVSVGGDGLFNECLSAIVCRFGIGFFVWCELFSNSHFYPQNSDQDLLSFRLDYLWMNYFLVARSSYLDAVSKQ